MCYVLKHFNRGPNFDASMLLGVSLYVPSRNVGLIKLVLKSPSLESFHPWIPISLMGGCAKKITKLFAQVDTSYPIWIMRNTFIENWLVQLVLDRVYYHVNWSFSLLVYTMGFGPCMSRLIFLLGQDAVSQVMLNGGIT